MHLYTGGPVSAPATGGVFATSVFSSFPLFGVNARPAVHSVKRMFLEPAPLLLREMLLHGCAVATVNQGVQGSHHNGAQSTPPCILTHWEPKFRTYLKAIFDTPGLLPEGSIVDCGAERGGEACWFADLAPNRSVIAIEPLPKNIASIRKVAVAGRPNIVPLHGGLGSVERIVNIHTSKHTKSGSMLIDVHKAPSAVNESGTETFPIYRLDDLFGIGGENMSARVANVGLQGAFERLAFGHFDVEGAEVDLLKGATRVIMRDRPIFTIETGSASVTYSNALKVLTGINYTGYVVKEQCGVFRSCRNVLCFPVERLPPAWLVNGTEALGS